MLPAQEPVHETGFLFTAHENEAAKTEQSCLRLKGLAIKKPQ
jgi:hypothetical protein